MDFRSILKSRWFLPLGKLLVFALLVWGMWKTIRGAASDLSVTDWTLRPAWLFAAGGCYLLGLVPAGLFWRHVLRTMGQAAGVWESLRAYIIGHLGKYVPGKALVVILRTGLIRSHRVDTSLAAVSVFYETFCLMTAGMLTAILVLLVWHPEQRILILISVALLAAVGLPALPPVFKRLVRFTAKVKTHPEAMIHVQRLNFRTFAVGQLAMLLAWLLMGLSLLATLRAIDLPPDISATSSTTASTAASLPTPQWSDLPVCMASIALAVVAGFLSMIPGGLGVRDLILGQLLAPRFGQAPALLSSVLLRLTWLVAELLISAILYIVKPASAKTPFETHL